jgi:hypothetical protein
MSSPKEDGARPADTLLSAPTPSAGVRLEVAILDADHDAAMAPAMAGEQPHFIVLVVAAEADLRRYVRECLRDRRDIVVLETDTVTAARTIAERESPKIFIVDEREAAMLAVLLRLRVILIVDDEPRYALADARVRLLPRPFSAERLLAEVVSLLDS